MIEVRSVLQEAIDQGGTTLRDYATPDGNAGYFKIRLNVYGRAGESCPKCDTTLKDTRISGRATVWCPICQR
jgi:formamidopyrimidine-DNA glycosylase